MSADSKAITTISSKIAPKKPLRDTGTPTAQAPIPDTPTNGTPKRDSGGKKGRSGPPAFNINATKNGVTISRLTLGELPNTMRRQLQNARVSTLSGGLVC